MTPFILIYEVDEVFYTPDGNDDSRSFFYWSEGEAIKKYTELRGAFKDNENAPRYGVNLRIIRYRDFLKEYDWLIAEWLDNEGIEDVEPGLLNYLKNNLRGEEEQVLEEAAANMRDNWTNFDADGLTKVRIGIDRVYEAANRKDWNGAVEAFRWTQKKMCIADSIISPNDHEEDE